MIKHFIGICFMALMSFNAMAQGIIDVHSHVLTPELFSNLTKHKALMEEGFPLPQWSLEEQIKWMNDAGISTSVLTLAAPHPTFGKDKENIKAIHEQNQALANIKKKYSNKFLFCASLPLPNVKEAIKEAKFALEILKADGIKLATNANGQYLGDPELDPLFEYLNTKGIVIILHPHKPNPVNAKVMEQTPLAMQEYLSETTRAVCNMISRNILAKYANLKVVVPHCGAYLPLAIPRMQALTPVMQQNNKVGEIDYKKNLNTLYFDLAGAHSPNIIRTLLNITTPDKLLYGSDFPYAPSQVLSGNLKKCKNILQQNPI